MRGRFTDCIDNHFRRMTQYRRALASDVIDVFVPIDIPNFGATRTFDEKRFNFNLAKRAHRRVYAARNAVLRRGEKLG